MTGYLHPLYAASLAEFGTPRELSSCGGWILERNIPGYPYHDAMGCYPLFCCKRWDLVAQDLAASQNGLVSLALVTDPFGDFLIEDLKQEFDICMHYKEHYVTDLSRSLDQIVSKDHRKHARRSLRKVVVEVCANPLGCADEWTELYKSLTTRHRIGGIRAFSRQAFAAQLCVPGVVYFRVLAEGQLVGGNIFYLQNNVAYGHLSAFTDQGYSLGAPYAVKWAALEYFTGKADWMSLGAGSGLGRTTGDGLTLFKRGWSTGTRPVYFCGCILDRERYAELAGASSMSDSSYFPAYRAGEFS